MPRLLWMCACVAGACSVPDEEPITPGPAPAEVRHAIQTVADPDSAVDWQSWSRRAFDEARTQQRPVLLYVARPGCDGLFSGDDPLARWLAETRYLPVRIDPDLHPHVAHRYTPAGCPSLAILRNDGELIVRATDIPPHNVPVLLSRIHEHLQKRPDVVDKEIEQGRTTDADADLSVPLVRNAILATYDATAGGFGGPIKFSEPMVLGLLADLAQRGDTTATRMLHRTLDALLASPTWQDGQVAALSLTPDWRMPAAQAHIADQAYLLTVLADVSHNSANYRQAAQRLFDAIEQSWFVDDSQAFAHRRTMTPASTPAPTPVYADANASMILALLTAGPMIERQPNALRLARTAGDRLLLLVETDGAVRHATIDAAPTGLARDQWLAVLAFDALADQSPDNRAYRDAAQRAFQWAQDHLWDATLGTYTGSPKADWPSSWSEPSSAQDGRYPSDLALAVQVLIDRGALDRARSLLHAPLAQDPGRQHASLARLLLHLERTP